MGVTGDPDITGCLCGRHLEFEVKRLGQQPTADATWWAIVGKIVGT